MTTVRVCLLVAILVGLHVRLTCSIREERPTILQTKNASQVVQATQKLMRDRVSLLETNQRLHLSQRAMKGRRRRKKKREQKKKKEKKRKQKREQKKKREQKEKKQKKRMQKEKKREQKEKKREQKEKKEKERERKEKKRVQKEKKEKKEKKREQKEKKEKERERKEKKRVQKEKKEKKRQQKEKKRVQKEKKRQQKEKKPVQKEKKREENKKQEKRKAKKLRLKESRSTMPLSERVEKLEQEVYFSIPCVITSREGDEKEMPELSTKEECVKVCTNRSTSKCHWNGKKFQDHEQTACLVFDSTGKKIVNDKTKTLQQCRNKCDRYHLVKNNKQRLCQFGAYVFHESTWGEFIEDRLESHNVTVENRLESLDEATKEHLTLVTSAKEAIEEATPKIERLWNDKAVRDNYNLLMDHRLAQDKNDERTFCEKDADRGVAVFPAIEVEGEPDELFCVDKNREIMIQSFCEFVPKLDELLKENSLTKDGGARTFWPRICCKERRFSELQECDGGLESIPREEIVPFAMSQGGKMTRENVFSEIKATLKANGELHNGMGELLIFLKGSLKDEADTKALNEAEARLKTFFSRDISLCGPRLFEHKNGEKMFCQLFLPYQHTMTSSLHIVKSFFARKNVEKMEVQQAQLRGMGFLELAKLRQAHSSGRAGHLQSTMRTKPMMSQKQTCEPLPGVTTTASQRDALCVGYQHLDLESRSPEIQNFALVNGVFDGLSDPVVEGIQAAARYNVVKDTCPSNLFHPKDISIQKLSSRWVAIVELDSASPDGYIRAELPSACARSKLPGTIVHLDVYLDSTGCCTGIPDYQECRNTNPTCASSMKVLSLLNRKLVKAELIVTGTQFSLDWESRGRRRRRLLQHHQGHC